MYTLNEEIPLTFDYIYIYFASERMPDRKVRFLLLWCFTFRVSVLSFYFFSPQVGCLAVAYFLDTCLF